jgi:FtsP/CotA-like multicopper oxidase with cupredoxin domain
MPLSVLIARLRHPSDSLTRRRFYHIWHCAYGAAIAQERSSRMGTDTHGRGLLSRRNLLKLGAAGVTLFALRGVERMIVPDLARRGLLSPDGVFDAASIAIADAIYIEEFPTSPLILRPFNDELPIPKALAPVPRSSYRSWASPPGAAAGQQSSMSSTQKHQIWPSKLGYPSPIVYQIRLQVAAHQFTTSQVLPIDSNGRPTVSFDAAGTSYAPGTIRTLPASTIYGFNGTFPGPMINAEYGKPVLIRFINELGDNPLGLDRQDFGAPDYSFLTHLHNAHTAPESDGNPNYSMKAIGYPGYEVGQWCDNLYLNYPAGGDDREKQSFFWFHDHRMDHTGSNVYKGMVGLYPIYDPKNGMDMGDERQGLRLPGVRTNNADGSFDVKYDIPLAFFDCRLDDGVTTHKDIHDGLGEFPAAGNPRTHPEWWGKTFFKHFPNHGFVGDIFTVNGTAYPVLEVKRRKYRLRFLDASIARCYEFKLMSSTEGPKAAKDLGYSGDELQGQYRIPDGEQCMKFVQIASDGGLLPAPITRDSFELWPAKRREFVVDFTRYMDGTPTTKGDVIYLTNVMKMGDGRMWDSSSRFSPDPDYKVPVLKIVIGDDAPDESLMPTGPLRELPAMPSNWQSLMNNRLIFEVQRGSAGGEIEWLINGQPFDPTSPARSLKNPAGNRPLARQKLGSYNLWEIRNGGGGWIHPFHLHMEEHRTLMRNGKLAIAGDPGHPDDASREDLINLDPGESVIVGRYFRDFVGSYVAHCHNLAHEDHAMMFGWEVIK